MKAASLLAPSLRARSEVSTWWERRLRRRLPMCARRIGEASHPGPPPHRTRKEVTAGLRSAKGILKVLAVDEFAPINAVRTAAAEARTAMLAAIAKLEALEKVTPKNGEPRLVVCPLCYDTDAERDAQLCLEGGDKMLEADYRAHFERYHFCAMLRQEDEPRRGAEDAKEWRQVAETRENGAEARAEQLFTALEDSGEALRGALDRSFATGSGDPLLAELKRLQGTVPELSDESVLGSAADLVTVSNRFGRDKQAAVARVTDALRALASVLQVPANEGARRTKNVEEGVDMEEATPLPSGVAALKKALEDDLGPNVGAKLSETQLGQQLIEMKVSPGASLNAAWHAAVLGAVIVRTGCVPAVVRAKFVSLNERQNGRVSQFVAGAPTIDSLPGRQIVYRTALQALLLAAKDGSEDAEQEQEQEDPEQGDAEQRVAAAQEVAAAQDEGAGAGRAKMPREGFRGLATPALLGPPEAVALPPRAPGPPFAWGADEDKDPHRVARRRGILLEAAVEALIRMVRKAQRRRLRGTKWQVQAGMDGARAAVASGKVEDGGPDFQHPDDEEVYPLKLSAENAVTEEDWQATRRALMMLLKGMRRAGSANSRETPRSFSCILWRRCCRFGKRVASLSCTVGFPRFPMCALREQA